MTTTSGAGRTDAASRRMPSSVSVVLPVILSALSIQYADGTLRIDCRVFLMVASVSVAIEESSSFW